MDSLFLPCIPQIWILFRNLLPGHTEQRAMPSSSAVTPVQLGCHRFAPGANLSCNRAWRRIVPGKTAHAVCTLMRLLTARLPCGSHTRNECFPKGIHTAPSTGAPTAA